MILKYKMSNLPIPLHCLGSLLRLAESGVSVRLTVAVAVADQSRIHRESGGQRMSLQCFHNKRVNYIQFV